MPSIEKYACQMFINFSVGDFGQFAISQSGHHGTLSGVVLGRVPEF